MWSRVKVHFDQHVGCHFSLIAIPIVRIRPLPGRLQIVQKLIAATPEIAECDKVTGDDCFIARLFVRSMEHLDKVVESIAEEATTNTSIVKGQLIKRRSPPIV